MRAWDWNLRSMLPHSMAISRTRRWKGPLRRSKSVDFWYLRISRNATVPGRKRTTGFEPTMDPALLRAAFEANCLRGAFPLLHLLATCFVRAIVQVRQKRGARIGWTRALEP